MIWILIIRSTTKICFEGEKEKQEWSLMASSNTRMSRNYMKEVGIKYYHKFLNICILCTQNSVYIGVKGTPKSETFCLHALSERNAQTGVCSYVREFVNLESMPACALNAILFNGMEVEDHIW